MFSGAVTINCVPKRKAPYTSTPIQHSHTASAAYPSQTDINLALMDRREEGKVVGKEQIFPGVIYLIASLADGEEPLRGFEISEDEVREIELIVE